MSKVLELHPNKNGDQSFVLCSCTDEGGDMLPIVIRDRQGPIISALVCVECDKELPVVNGIVGNAPESA